MNYLILLSVNLHFGLFLLAVMKSYNSLIWYSNWCTPIIESAWLVMKLFVKDYIVNILWLGGPSIDCVTVQSIFLTTVIKQYMSVAE